MQNSLNLQAVLGKPGDGWSTINKSPMAYRMSLRVGDEVSEWESCMTGSFDTASKGNSDLIAAACRCIDAEANVCTAEPVVATYHGVTKLFDIASMPTLIEQGIELESPMLDLMVTLHQHMAQNILKCEGSVAGLFQLIHLSQQDAKIQEHSPHSPDCSCCRE